MNNLRLNAFLEMALEEDIGTGDITTEATIPADARATGRYIAKSDGVICGLFLLQRTFDMIGKDATVTLCVSDGDTVKRGDVVATVEGNATQILTGERVGLNLVQRLSGIATATARAVAQIAGTQARIADTRKTTPAMRELEKYAVRVGGGSNHRFGLSDGVLIKDNHIAAAGSITAAVQAARGRIPHTMKIEVEVEQMTQLDEALSAGADIIMLDNMSYEEMSEAVKRIDGRAMTEASGNMGERDLRAVAATGVDLISIGALTHTVIPMDISLKFTLA